MYEQGKEFIGHDFRKSLIEEEYGVTSKPRTLANTMSNAALERINQVIGNLVRTYNISKTFIDKYDPWSVILAEAAFVIISTKNRIKVHSPGQLIFGRDTILPIEHTVDWELLRQRNQTQINKYNI